MEVESLRRWRNELLLEKVRAVRVLPTSLAEPEQRRELLVFPGAFNPLHAGHRAMADAAQERLQRPVEFEISLVNVDKPALSLDELIRRVQQFPPHEALWLTRAARFTEKAELFPAATFVAGVDTITRLIDVRYYDGDERRRGGAIEHLAARGCRFLVFGRATASGFQTLSQLKVPRTLAAICDEVTEAEFRHDLSSTELRIAKD